MPSCGETYHYHIQVICVLSFSFFCFFHTKLPSTLLFSQYKINTSFFQREGYCGLDYAWKNQYCSPDNIKKEALVGMLGHSEGCTHILQPCIRLPKEQYSFKKGQVLKVTKQLMYVVIWVPLEFHLFC